MQFVSPSSAKRLHVAYRSTNDMNVLSSMGLFVAFAKEPSIALCPEDDARSGRRD